VPISGESTGKQWVAAPRSARIEYAISASFACSPRGLNSSLPDLVVDRIDAFFNIPKLRRKKVLFAFEQIKKTLGIEESERRI
jgi:hypothetical protein